MTARTVANRLDNVLGPANWWPEFHQWSDRGVLCRLTIRLPDGKELTKADIGGYADMADGGDGEKAGTSDAFKRAAVMFGVGRHLYNDGVPEFASHLFEGNGHQQARQEAPRQQQYSGNGGGNGGGYSNGGGQQQNGGNGNGGRQYDGPPRSGRGLFAWVKEQEQRHEVALLKYLNNWGRDQGYSDRMVDWGDDQIREAHAEAIRKLQAMGGRGEESQEVASGSAGDDIPFDLGRARGALDDVVARLAGKIFRKDPRDVARHEAESALSSLDNIVGTDNVVGDWHSCREKAKFAAYYRAAVQAVKEYDDPGVAAVLRSA